MNKIKKVVVIVLCLVLAAGSWTSFSAREEGAAAERVYAASSNKVSKAYKKKLAKLAKKEKYKDGISSLQISCGEGKKILVVTPSSSLYFDGETTEVDVYQYVKGKVKHIGAVASGGTAYPIMYTKEAILFGGHRNSGKLVIKKGKGTLYEITRMNMNGRNPVYSKYSVKNGKRTKITSYEISASKADSLDYYMGENASQSRILQFK